MIDLFSLTAVIVWGHDIGMLHITTVCLMINSRTQQISELIVSYGGMWVGRDHSTWMIKCNNNNRFMV